MDKKAIYNSKRHLIEKNLGEALKAIAPLSGDFLYAPLHERISNLTSDYDLMLSYMRNGYPDPSRRKLYLELLRKLDRTVNDAALIQRMQRDSSCRRFSINISQHQYSHTEIKQRLEEFVGEVAMLNLAEGDTASRSDTLYHEHHELMSNIFSALCFSAQWHSDDAQFWESLLLSPIIDINDAALLVSAITLSVTTYFDVYKYTTLANIYRKSSDPQVRQRALVGWALSTTRTHELYPEVTELVEEMTSDATISHELLEMQMQMFYCMNAEKDQDEIRRDIMPTLMKNKGFDITRDGIVEKDDDPMQDILDPSSSDRAMDELEKSMQRMLEMQRNGSDIYFGGFSQMKRYGFFYTLSNWFCPFYVEHPSLAATRRKLNDNKFLNMLLENGPFCDSDKYSFALAMASVIDKIPANMREALNDGASFGPVSADSLLSDESKIRLMYLQDLYRFYRLSDARVCFYNPFGGDSGRYALFFAYAIYGGKINADDMLKIGNFLLKRGQYASLRCLLESIPASSHDVRYHILKGYSDMESGNFEGAISSLRTAHEQSPGNRRATSALARALMMARRYPEASECYRELHAGSPEVKSYALNLALSLIKQGKASEASPMLFKLSYEHSNDKGITRVLAWCLLASHKLDQASKEYDRLLSAEAPSAEDYLNSGYCHWMQGDIRRAIELFGKYEASNKGRLKEEFEKDRDVLTSGGISGFEMNMMMDIVGK